MTHAVAVGPAATVGSGGTRTITLNGVTEGHGIVVALCFDSGSTISVACNGESSLTATNATPFNPATFGGTDRLMIYCLDSVTEGGDKTVTISGVNSYCAGAGMSVSGGNTGGWLDAEGGSTGTGATASTSNTTTAANDMVLAIAASNASDAAASGAGYVEIAIGNPNNFANGEYNLDVGAAGSKTVGMDLSAGGSQPWGIYAASFKAAPEGELFEITPTAALELNATLSVSGDVSAVVTVPFEFGAPLQVGLTGTLTVAGDIEFGVASVPAPAGGYFADLGTLRERRLKRKRLDDDEPVAAIQPEATRTEPRTRTIRTSDIVGRVQMPRVGADAASQIAARQRRRRHEDEMLLLM